jgi:hypothetical protein
MTIPHRDPAELMAGVDWAIDGALLDVNGQPFDLSIAELTWTPRCRRRNLLEPICEDRVRLTSATSDFPDGNRWHARASADAQGAALSGMRQCHEA